jgi:hypothetical protein
VTLSSLHPNVSSSLENNDASTFTWPSSYLHTLLRCLGDEDVDLEMPNFLGRFGESW